MPHKNCSHSPGAWSLATLIRMSGKHLQDLKANAFRPVSLTFKPDNRRVLRGTPVNRSGVSSPSAMCADATSPETSK